MKTSDGLLIITFSSLFFLSVILSDFDITDRNLTLASTINSLPISEARSSKLDWQKLSENVWNKRDSQFSYVFNNELYMTGGLDATDTFTPFKNEPVYEKATYFNDIWKTSDGINWSLITSSSTLPKLRSSSVVNFNGKLFLYNGWGPEVGMNNKIYTSVDGINWKIEKSDTNFIPREGQRMLVAKGKIYMFGGVNYFSREVFNDVWISDDGLNFSLLTKDAPWSGRWDHDVTFFKGKFFLVGGMNLNMDSFNDVWVSEDGIGWTLLTDNAPWSERQGHVLISYKDMMYLVGGLDAKSNIGSGETWYSKNGVDWKKTDKTGNWTGREDHQVVVFNDRLILFGGMDSEWEWKNDIWVSFFNY